MSSVLSIPLLSKAWGALYHSLHLINEATKGEGVNKQTRLSMILFWSSRQGSEMANGLQV